MSEPDDLLSPELSPEITAHCFFAGTCDHTETGTPEWVNAEMEQHYERHADEITRVLNGALVLGVGRR